MKKMPVEAVQDLTRKVYDRLVDDIIKTADRCAKETKDNMTIGRIHATALTRALIGVLAFCHQVRGEFKDLPDHFDAADHPVASYESAKDACDIIAQMLTKADPNYDFSVQIIRRPK